MQEKTIIKMTSVGVLGIRRQVDEQELILLNELLASKSKIEDLLVGYYFNSRGRVYDVRINKPVFNSETEGFFFVTYHIGHFNACADIDTYEEEKMKIGFQLNLQSGELTLTGEYFPEREPDEF